MLHNTAEPNLIYGHWYNHYFGYQTYMPENIIIDNFDITCGKTVNLFTAHFVEQSKHILDDEIDGKPNANKMVPPKKIVIKNNKAGINYIKPDTAFFKDTVIVEE